MWEQEIDSALKEGRLYLSPIVASELLSGSLSSKEKKSLIDFLSDLPLCPILLDHWIRVGDLRAKLISKGVKLSTPDAHIAQCSLDLEGYLFTEDKIFEKIAPYVDLKMWR